MPLTIRHQVPAEFTQAGVPELADTLGEPTLFDLPGRRKTPLFVTVLQHGNEHSGLLGMQEVLRRHAATGLPRRLLLFVANVAAAAAGVRTLPEQPDFNRVWPGTEHPPSPESDLMRDVVEYVAAQSPIASIDLHNTTGRSPPYACVNRLQGPYFQLARLFSRTVVFFERPVGVQSAAMAEICPAVTVECGRSGESAATMRAADFVESCLAMTDLADALPAPAQIDLLRTFTIIKIPAGVSFSFDSGAAEIRFRDDLDRLNFAELAPGTTLGTHAFGDRACLDLEPEPHLDVPCYFDFSDGRIRLIEPAIPAMLTRDEDAVRLDCLGYLMHRIDFSGRRLPD